VPLRRDGSDAADVVGALSLEPARLHQISRQNARQALLRHDWAHRWRRVLEIAGLEVSPALEAREQRLKATAALIES